jgi:hypothetical protein
MLLTAPHFGIGENEMRLRAGGLRAVVLRAAESQPETDTLSELAALQGTRKAWKMSNDSRADYGTDRLPGQRFPLPSERDCYDCANRCLDMWNDSVDHAARSQLLRMADAWLQLASESDNHRRTEQPHGRDIDRQPVVATDRHPDWGCAGLPVQDQ